MKSCLIRVLKKFNEDKNGNIAIIFAFALLPLLASVCFAIDFSRASDARAHLQSFADQAVLAGTSDQSLQLTGLQESSKPAITKIVQDSFNASASSYGYVQGVSSAITVTIDSAQITVKIDYAAQIDSILGSIFRSDYSITGSSQSINTLNSQTYIDFYMVLDVSQSMGIAATDVDQADLIRATQDLGNGISGCAFACHQINPDLPNRTSSTTNLTNEQIARQVGVILQIDVMKTAVSGVLDLASKPLAQNVYRFGLYPFNYSVTTALDLSSDINAIKSTLGGIDLGDWGPTYGNTYFPEMFAGMMSRIKKSGEGKTQQDSKKILFLVTDGVNNVLRQGDAESADITAMSPDGCNAIKALGIRIAVLQTKYPALDWGTYQDVIRPMLPTIQTNLQSCASPGLYYLATDSTAITKGLQDLFSKSVIDKGSRLTQ